MLESEDENGGSERPKADWNHICHRDVLDNVDRDDRRRWLLGGRELHH